MRCTILRAFPFSRDGIRPIFAAKGEDHDIPDDLVPGLVAEGFVSVIEAEAAPVEPAPSKTDNTDAASEADGEADGGEAEAEAEPVATPEAKPKAKKA